MARGLKLRLRRWWNKWQGFFLGLAMGPIVYCILLLIAEWKKWPMYNCPVCGEKQKLYKNQEQCPCCRLDMEWNYS